MNNRDFIGWHKSTRSNSGNECVEVGRTADGGMVGVRDTKDRDGGTVVVGRTAWVAFLGEAGSSYRH